MEFNSRNRGAPTLDFQSTHQNFDYHSDNIWVLTRFEYKLFSFTKDNK